MGGPRNGEEWTYFSEEMDVEICDGNPVLGPAVAWKGTYKHDGNGAWIWFGPPPPRLIGN